MGYRQTGTRYRVIWTFESELGFHPWYKYSGLANGCEPAMAVPLIEGSAWVDSPQTAACPRQAPERSPNAGRICRFLFPMSASLHPSIPVLIQSCLRNSENLQNRMQRSASPPSPPECSVWILSPPGKIKKRPGSCPPGRFWLTGCDY
jgi:hypothetical protein